MNSFSSKIIRREKPIVKGEPHENFEFEMCLCCPNPSEAVSGLLETDETVTYRVDREYTTLLELPFSCSRRRGYM